MLVDKLIIGGAQIGLKYGISNRVGQWSEDSLTAILETAYSHGINLLDTAHHYGTSEQSIGNYLKSHPEENWDVITKVKDNVDDLNKSIGRLGKVPCAVLAHNCQHYCQNADFRESLWRMKDTLGIKKIGVSVYSKDEIENAIVVQAPDIIQLPVSALDTRFSRSGTIEELKSKDVEIHARSVFLQGLLYLSPTQIGGRFPTAMNSIKTLNEIAVGEGFTLGELSLLLAVKHSSIDKVVIGIDSLSQLKQHLKSLNKPIPKNIYGKVEAINFKDERVLNPLLWPSA